ncbi:MAG: DUF1446 domain-containing protein, partial [Burkholderiales bacterium]
LMHEFQWSAHDYDELAQASIAGHVIECGCQGTGGLFTDWQLIPDWEHMGFPIVDCEADGAFTVTKPAGTGGLVTPATVGEQLLYEVGDPARYLLPDVICDFSQVQLVQSGDNRVRVTGVRGLAPTGSYKVSATYVDGYKSVAQLTVIGVDAAQKAKRVGDAILSRVRSIFQARGMPDFQATLVEVLGAESVFGPHATALHTREVVLRIAARHADRAALAVFAGEIAPAATAFCQGITGVGGRPQATPAIKQCAFLLDKDRLQPHAVLDGQKIAVAIPGAQASRSFIPTPRIDAALPRTSGSDTDLATDVDPVEVPLIRIAHGRSGDKGDMVNVGLMARTPALLPYLRREVTRDKVKTWLAHLVEGEVDRFDLPGLRAVNFLCKQALGGGGMASLRNDPLGKGMAQIVLAMPVTVPRSLLPAVE